MATNVTTITGDSSRHLLALKSKLAELLGSLPDRDELQIEYSADPLDQVKSSTDRELTVQHLDRRAKLIHEIQAALGKVAGGGYGECERCEEPIARKRLEALPWARLCVACQGREELAAQDMKFTVENAA